MEFEKQMEELAKKYPYGINEKVISNFKRKIDQFVTEVAERDANQRKKMKPSNQTLQEILKEFGYTQERIDSLTYEKEDPKHGLPKYWTKKAESKYPDVSLPNHQCFLKYGICEELPNDGFIYFEICVVLEYNFGFFDTNEIDCKQLECKLTLDFLLDNRPVHNDLYLCKSISKYLLNYALNYKDFLNEKNKKWVKDEVRKQYKVFIFYSYFTKVVYPDKEEDNVFFYKFSDLKYDGFYMQIKENEPYTLYLTKSQEVSSITETKFYKLLQFE